jgi:hypothetical protein
MAQLPLALDRYQVRLGGKAASAEHSEWHFHVGFRARGPPRWALCRVNVTHLLLENYAMCSERNHFRDWDQRLTYLVDMRKRRIAAEESRDEWWSFLEPKLRPAAEKALDPFLPPVDPITGLILGQLANPDMCLAFFSSTLLTKWMRQVFDGEKFTGPRLAHIIEKLNIPELHRAWHKGAQGWMWVGINAPERAVPHVVGQVRRRKKVSAARAQEQRPAPKQPSAIGRRRKADKSKKAK